MLIILLMLVSGSLAKFSHEPYTYVYRYVCVYTYIYVYIYIYIYMLYTYMYIYIYIYIHKQMYACISYQGAPMLIQRKRKAGQVRCAPSVTRA